MRRRQLLQNSGPEILSGPLKAPVQAVPSAGPGPAPKKRGRPPKVGVTKPYIKGNPV